MLTEEVDGIECILEDLDRFNLALKARLDISHARRYDLDAEEVSSSANPCIKDHQVVGIARGRATAMLCSLSQQLAARVGGLADPQGWAEDVKRSLL